MLPMETGAFARRARSHVLKNLAMMAKKITRKMTRTTMRNVPQTVALDMSANSKLFMLPSIPYLPDEGKEIIVFPDVQRY